MPSDVTDRPRERRPLEPLQFVTHYNGVLSVNFSCGRRKTPAGPDVAVRIICNLVNG